MKWAFKSIGTATILLAASGCAGEGPPSPAPENAPVGAPAPSANAQAGAAGGGMAAEMQPPGSTAPPAAKSGQTADSGPKVEGPAAEHDKAAAATGGPDADQLAAIKELPAGEQQAAIKQASCPVSGEPLGSMGKPYKVSVEGRSFYLCCKGCEKDVKANPKAVLVKLDQKRP